MTMPFGKYSGEELADIRADYLEWVLENCDNIRPSLRSAIENELRDRDEAEQAKRRDRQRGREEKPGAFASLSMSAEEKRWLPQMLEAGYRSLALRHHPDRGGQPDTMRVINSLMEKVRRLAL